MYFEISIVILLTLINDLLAMSKLAIVSARPTRLKLLADKGSKGAATAMRLAEDPGRFLSRRPDRHHTGWQCRKLF